MTEMANLTPQVLNPQVAAYQNMQKYLEF